MYPAIGGVHPSTNAECLKSDNGSVEILLPLLSTGDLLERMSIPTTVNGGGIAVVELLEITKNELALLMHKDARTLIDVWTEWDKRFTEFCERFEVSGDSYDVGCASAEHKKIADAYFRILDAVWLARDSSPIVAKYIDDEVQDLASEFNVQFSFRPPDPGNITSWRTLRDLKKRLMANLEGYRDHVLFSIALSNEGTKAAIETVAGLQVIVPEPDGVVVPGISTNEIAQVGDELPKPDEATQPCKWSEEVRTFSEWMELFGWSERTWTRRRKSHSQCFKVIAGENSCRIREPELSDWLASGANKKPRPRFTQ